MKEPIKHFKSSVYRSNLFYEIIFKDFLQQDPIENLKDFILDCLKIDTDTLSKNDCGIIYCKYIFKILIVVISLRQKFNLFQTLKV